MQYLPALPNQCTCRDQTRLEEQIYGSKDGAPNWLIDASSRTRGLLVPAAARAWLRTTELMGGV
ncbi:hypothetical protein E5D57_006559 [Metarhizium anisopliae]|nr:hypothetical protein E5D57_006559 [Metarhizium anisopliae]